MGLPNYKSERIGEFGYNNNGELMKIIEYNNHSDIIVEFQDKYKYRAHTQYGNFKSGGIRNIFSKSVFGVGITGNKYPTKVNGIRKKNMKCGMGC